MNKPKPLLIAGCFHIGAKTADMEMAHAYIDFIRKEDGFCLLLADNHECAVPQKAWMMFEQDLTPQEQLDASVELFRPIRRNIVGSVTGNHAWRAYHNAGIEMDKEMMTRLGLLHKYYGFQGYIEIPYGKQRYKVVFAHGTNIGANIFKNCERLNHSYPGADLYCASHAHVLGTTSKETWHHVKGKLELHPFYYVSTGSLLNYPLYAGEALYQPQTKGFAIAWLYPDQYRVDIDVSGQIPGFTPSNTPQKLSYPNPPPFQCEKCGSIETIKMGTTAARGAIKQRYYCKPCNLEKCRKQAEKIAKNLG